LSLLLCDSCHGAERLRMYCANVKVEPGRKRSEPNRRTALLWFVSEKAEDNYENIQKSRSLGQISTT